MPEPAAWKYQKITKHMTDLPVFEGILRGRIITCTERGVIEDGFVEVADGKVQAVGEVADLGSRGEGSDVVDLRGSSIMPGIINSHAHLAWDGVHDLARQSMDDAPEIQAYKSAANMQKSLRAGVTLVRDLGVRTANLFAKQALTQGIIAGPRVLVCGEAIVQTGGHTYWACREASGADEMRRAVRAQVRGGADLIKIMACHDTLEMTDAELQAVIDEAHRNSIPITAHATYDACIERVVRFGIDVVEHGGSMSDSTIKLLVDRGVPIVTTFAPLVMQSKPEVARAFGIPEWKIEERQRAVADTSRFEGLAKAAKAGVRVAFGTDAGSPAVEHNVVAPELEFMVKVGVVDGNMGALQSATSVPAEIHGLSDRLGTVSQGKEADLIVVDGNPDSALGSLERVRMTFVAGKRLV